MAPENWLRKRINEIFDKGIMIQRNLFKKLDQFENYCW